MQLSVIVPVYNEAPTLRASVGRLLKADLGLPLEVLVVDDGSTDGSAETIEDLIERGEVRLLRHPMNKGKGAAVRTGIEHASGQLLTVYDGDLEYDPSDYQELLLAILDDGANVAYGTRAFKGHTAYSFWFVIGNKLVALWASFLFNTWISDVETCFKVAETGAWRALNLRSRDFGIEAEATGKFLRSGHRIYEVPISYRARTREEGKKIRAIDGFKAFWILLRVRLFGV